MPLVSVVVASRLDDYGGSQLERIQAWTDYWIKLTSANGGETIWEFVVVDWAAGPEGSGLNTTSLHRLPGIKFIFPSESELESREHRNSSFQLHRALNLGAEFAKGDWFLITNLDIFPSETIFRQIGERNLRNRTIYLSDRTDLRLIPQGGVDSLAKISDPRDFWLFEGMRNIRHHPSRGPIVIKSFGSESDKTAQVQWGEAKEGVARIWRISKTLRFALQVRLARIKWLLSAEKSHSRAVEIFHEFLEFFGIHSNASGDFILMPARNWERIKGFSLPNETYWHLDTDIVWKALRIGMRHAAFEGASTCFHMITAESGQSDGRYDNRLDYSCFAACWISNIEITRFSQCPLADRHIFSVSVEAQ